MIAMFIDSLSAIQAIESQTKFTDHIYEICCLINNFRSAGTLISLCWIPSHCGISGNEVVDKLAKRALSNPSTPTHTQSIALADTLCLVLHHWHSDLISNIKKKSKGKFNTDSRTRLWPLPCHSCSSKIINRALHKLRSAHNHLNYFLNKLDPSISPVCPYNYNAMDNIQHVLIDCPILSAFRLPLLSWLNDKRLVPTISTILGFNPTLTSAEQICLRNRLIKFIKSSGLILRL